MTRIIAVVTSYDPDLPLLETNLTALAPQVDAIILVDDGSAAKHLTGVKTLCARLGVSVISGHGNCGIGAALNKGIAAARDMGAQELLLLDQDSTPAPDMVAGLRAGCPADGVAGPLYREALRDTALPFAVTGLPVEMPALITSGMFLRLDLFDRVGPFDESLFMDLTDTDWSFRARALGLRLYGVPDARLSHRIGSGVLPLLGRNMAVHDPARSYYQIRNTIRLCARAHSPWGWRLTTLPRVLLRSLVLSVLTPPRLHRFGMVLRGVRDGILGRNGSI